MRLLFFAAITAAAAIGAPQTDAKWDEGKFLWRASPPLLSAAERPGDPCFSIKDPSIVYDQGRWHVFATIRSKVRSHQIEYLSFRDFPEASAAPRHILTLTNGYFCAPQVFFFRPHKSWYLLYQIAHGPGQPGLQPAFSVTRSLADPSSWSPPQPLFESMPKSVKSWIDFWVICDEGKAHLFFTSNDGRMWRSETTRTRFPKGWSEPAVVLKADVFEASHTYRLKGQNRYVTLIEAIGQGRRYYKAYLANRLDGAWEPLAATPEKPFASLANVTEESAHWADSISHGELLRFGSDEWMEIDPQHLRFFFQGALDREMKGRPYGEIPWRLGLLESREEK